MKETRSERARKASGLDAGEWRRLVSDNLTLRATRIVQARDGVDVVLSFSDIAEDMSVSRARVSQLERKALKKLGFEE